MTHRRDLLAPARRARRGSLDRRRPSWRPLAVVGGGLASAVLAGAAWSATAAPTVANNGPARASQRQEDSQVVATEATSTPSAARAAAAALAAVGPGLVTQVVSGPGGAAGMGYVVEIRSASGLPVHVLVDGRFAVRASRIALPA